MFYFSFQMHLIELLTLALANFGTWESEELPLLQCCEVSIACLYWWLTAYQRANQIMGTYFSMAHPRQYLYMYVLFHCISSGVAAQVGGLQRIRAPVDSPLFSIAAYLPPIGVSPALFLPLGSPVANYFPPLYRCRILSHWIYLQNSRLSGGHFLMRIHPACFYLCSLLKGTHADGECHFTNSPHLIAVPTPVVVETHGDLVSVTHPPNRAISVHICSQPQCGSSYAVRVSFIIGQWYLPNTQSGVSSMQQGSLLPGLSLLVLLLHPHGEEQAFQQTTRESSWNDLVQEE